MLTVEGVEAGHARLATIMKGHGPDGLQMGLTEKISHPSSENAFSSASSWEWLQVLLIQR